MLLTPEDIDALATAIATALVRELPALAQPAAVASAPDTRTRLRTGPIVIDTARHEVLVNGVDIRLKPREFSTLECLVRNAGYVLSREQILEMAWPVDVALDLESNRNVDVIIHRLRKRLGEAGKLIEGITGRGYKLRDR
jgi:DNA-binding response OmpR family regulator